MRKAIRERFGPVVTGDEGEVDHFVEAHPELPECEREMLLGWRDVVEGIFAIERRDADASS